MLTSDAAEAFTESPGGFYDGPTAEKLVRYLFRPAQRSLDPAEAYRLFRGRDAGIEALIARPRLPDPGRGRRVGPVPLAARLSAVASGGARVSMRPPLATW